MPFNAIVHVLPFIECLFFVSVRSRRPANRSAQYNTYLVIVEERKRYTMVYLDL